MLRSVRQNIQRVARRTNVMTRQTGMTSHPLVGHNLIHPTLVSGMQFRFQSTDSHAEVVNDVNRPHDSGNGIKIAVVLSGCGYLDGSEITESVSTLIHIGASGSTATCFAPNKDQVDVINHNTCQPEEGQQQGQESKANQQNQIQGGNKRNCLAESARISRGNVQPLNTPIDPSQYDAIILPGGFGAAKNLSTFANDGPNMSVDPMLEKTIIAFHEAKKPMGFLCISPVIAAKVLGNKATVTLGGEKENNGEWPYAGAVEAVKKMGAKHVPTTLDQICIDRSARIVSGAAYMCGTAEPHAVFDNVGKVVEGVHALAAEEIH